MNILSFTTISIIVKKFAQNAFICIDFYVSYFIIPFIICSSILLLIRRLIKINIVLKVKKVPNTNSVQTQNNSNALYVLFFIFIIAVCLLVTFSIAGFYSPKGNFSFSKKLSTVFTEEQNIVQITCIDKAAVEAEIIYWDGNVKQLHLTCDIAKNCSPQFIENWRDTDAKSFIMARKSPQFEYCQIEYKDARGEWKKKLKRNEIALYLYNEKSYAYMQVEWNESLGEDMISKNEILNYCYLLLENQETIL